MNGLTTPVCYRRGVSKPGSVAARRPRRAWSSRHASGFEPARILDGGYAGWVASAAPVGVGETVPAPARFTPRLQARRRVTTGDVRGLMRAPDVVLIDARGPAEFHG